MTLTLTHISTGESDTGLGVKPLASRNPANVKRNAFDPSASARRCLSFYIPNLALPPPA